MRLSPRNASTYLEVLVAMAVFSVGLTGMAPLIVLNVRQAAEVAKQLPDGATLYLAPPADDWHRKLGVGATVSDAAIPVKPPPVLQLDDGESGYFGSGFYWFSIPGWGTYRNDFQLNSASPLGDYAQWSFDVDPGPYELFVTYPAFTFQTDNADYRVYDDGAQIGQARANQRSLPAGPTIEGVRWQSLGVHKTLTGKLQLRLYDDPGNYWVAADGVRLEPRRRSVALSTVQRSIENQTLTVTTVVTP